MTAISLKLPDELAAESKAVAERMGVSRTELIRQALRHELDAIEARMEREAMAQAFQAMLGDADYLRESEVMEEGFSETLPAEPDRWWEG